MPTTTNCRRSTCCSGRGSRYEEHEKEVRRQAKILEKTFLDFGFNGQGRRDRDRAGHRPVRGRTGSRPAAVEDHQPGRRPGHRPARAERAHRGADSRQEHGRHRSAQRRAAAGPPARSDRRGQRQGPEDADPDLPGQGRVRQADGRRPDDAAALADRRPHGHGQERVPELDHRLDADDAPARRSADADDRPEDGRTEPLQDAAAPDAPGGDRHAQGRGDSGLGRREDGRALCAAGPGRRAAHQRLQPAGRRRADGAAAAGGRRRAQARFPRTCRTS